MGYRLIQEATNHEGIKASKQLKSMNHVSGVAEKRNSDVCEQAKVH
jgi:hypothetical protein